MRGDQNNLGVEFFIMTLYTQNVLNSRTATENVEKNENQTKYTEFVKIESKCKILECTRERWKEYICVFVCLCECVLVLLKTRWMVSSSNETNE